ncbi:substrate-binding domain-containing protein [Streptomyces olivaceus]|uniref:substrate-binding domain-containing protein n=1 Tax=Streptomyces TaxID=1883 RepID=UPI001413DF5E|nr:MULTISPECIES: substrate-binding domain-containing protein [Streptomyces]MBZ6191567.1 substrate-binding domain-containing protein [Streptomyces olivaceus]MBZ6199528.1 substrate-binding domain-containing protein [Streptomyces olivaceus]MCC2266124.1 substrate-binding domain-containing protein [Streptomyces sp. CT1-17]QIP74346.1 DeoR family transcriptional regulator [Streptomyces sp. VN1]
MREPVDLRRQRILAAVQSRGSARVRDLAEELQVSVVTVRRDVEELTREGRLRRGHGVVRSTVPVQEAPAETAAAPDDDRVAVVVPVRHSYLNEALHGARTVLEGAGLRIALHLAPQAAGTERPLVERALADGAHGLLIAPRWRGRAEEEADHEWLAATGVPTVLMERRPWRGSALHALDSVCSDHWYGAHLAVEHLVGLGHRRMVFATRHDSPTARSLRAAFVEIAGAHPLVEQWAWALVAPEAGSDGPYTADETAELPALMRKVGATAVVLHGDVDALMIVQRLAEESVRVPQDCSVVAYDDVVAGLGSPPLTAVAPPKAEVGRTAAELLLRRLAEAPGARPGRRIELLPRLMVRGSTDRLAE